MKPLLTLTAMCVALLLLAAAPVGACDDGDKITPVSKVKAIQSFNGLSGRYIYNLDFGNARIGRGPDWRIDTTRFYAKVDTCLTCPKGYVQTYPGHTDMPKLYYCMQGKRAVYFNDSIEVWGWNGYILPDTVVKTTWLPKVQVWMDSTQYKRFKECEE